MWFTLVVTFFKNSKPQMNADKRRFVEWGDYRNAIEYGQKKGVKIFFSIPRIIKNINEISNFFSPQRQQRSQSELSPDGFLVANPGVLYHLRKMETTAHVVVDSHSISSTG